MFIFQNSWKIKTRILNFAKFSICSAFHLSFKMLSVWAKTARSTSLRVLSSSNKSYISPSSARTFSSGQICRNEKSTVKEVRKNGSKQYPFGTRFAKVKTLGLDSPWLNICYFRFWLALSLSKTTRSENSDSRAWWISALEWINELFIYLLSLVCILL